MAHYVPDFPALEFTEACHCCGTRVWCCPPELVWPDVLHWTVTEPNAQTANTSGLLYLEGSPGFPYTLGGACPVSNPGVSNLVYYSATSPGRRPRFPDTATPLDMYMTLFVCTSCRADALALSLEAYFDLDCAIPFPYCAGVGFLSGNRAYPRRVGIGEGYGCELVTNPIALEYSFLEFSEIIPCNFGGCNPAANRLLITE